MERSGVHAVLLNESVIFRNRNDGNAVLDEEASRLLSRLRYSELHLGIILLDTSDDSCMKKRIILQSTDIHGMATVLTLEQNSSSGELLNLPDSEWGVSPRQCVYLTCQSNEAFCDDLRSHGWSVVLVGAESRLDDPLSLEQINEFPAALAYLNKTALKEKVVVVGHAMKWSRELDFLKRNAFPIFPTQGGLSFIPICFENRLEQQLTVLDIILLKATDEIVSIHMGDSQSYDSVQFSDHVQKLERYLLKHPDICVVDPTNKVLPLVDRVATQSILRSVEASVHGIIRPPYSAEVTSFEEPELSKALISGKVKLPAIVKPKIACGTSKAHTMAVIFKEDGFKGLQVPLPATIQEYVDHGSVQYKVYVLGKKLLWACRKSTPNGASLAAQNTGLSAIMFDSLRSLPTSGGEDFVSSKQTSQDDSKDFNVKAAQKAADLLSTYLGLTIFGFDIVVQAGTRDHVIIDVNFFPSFKDIPDAKAIPAFWEALVHARTKWKEGYYSAIRRVP